MDQDSAIALALLIYLITTFALSVLYLFSIKRLRKLRLVTRDLEACETKKTDLFRENQDQKKRIAEYVERFRGVIDADSEQAQVREKSEKILRDHKQLLASIVKQTEEAQTSYNKKLERLKEIEEAIEPLEQVIAFHEIGFDQLHFELDDHAEYVFRIKQVREQQKQMMRDKAAVVCETDWTVGGSVQEGRRMINKAVRITLRAFNNECDNAISKVNWKNLEVVKKRIHASKSALDKLNDSLSVVVTQPFLEKKLYEAKLVSEEKIRKEQLKERLKAERALEREEERAQREIRAEIKRQEKREREMQKALKEVQAKLAIASDEHRAALQAQASELESEMAQSALEKGRLASMAEHTRVGHLYVISNKGSFGDGIIKIGMTRRLEPLERVKELGDASVPFPFDVHAIVFSEDAPRLEKELHNRFASRRLNKVNNRKEFFRVELTEVFEELSRSIPDLPFDFEAPSYDFMASMSGEKSNSSKSRPRVSDRFESSSS